MSPSLLILAAGMGSRYGGLKQMDPVGPSGEIMLDYAVYDAIRAGFGRVIFVIRRDFADEFRARIGTRYARRVAVDYVFQATDSLPARCTPHAARTKPWGTGHAVWCARAAVRENFAVINADDFYGADSFVQLAHFLAATPDTGNSGPHSFAMVSFRLNNTLSEYGAVSRGVCAVGPDGRLQAIVEQTGIRAEDVRTGRKFSGCEVVSMNCWGFTPAVFAALDRGFRDFLAGHSDDAQAEFYLPSAISAMIATGEAAVRVLPTENVWFGVTYREDRAHVQSALAALVEHGAYTKPLF